MFKSIVKEKGDFKRHRMIKSVKQTYAFYFPIVYLAIFIVQKTKTITLLE